MNYLENSEVMHFFNMLEIIPEELIQEIIAYLDVDNLNNFIECIPKLLKLNNWCISLACIKRQYQ